MLKPHYIGSGLCSRCGGKDPNCYVCQEVVADRVDTEDRYPIYDDDSQSDDVYPDPHEADDF